MNEPILKDVVILGGGPAGLAAALALWEQGVRDLVILEREPEAGGILRQCIHDGFGLTRFHEALTGPEYARRFLDPVRAAGIELHTGTTVTGLTAQRLVTAVSRRGLTQYQARAVILAMGCRERAAGALPIYGARPAGVFTAGVAQAYVNLYNTMVGREIVILGSGDIGLIMARRLTLEGAHVLGVYEILPHPSGLPRNVTQCLEDFHIPLHLSHTVTELHGAARLEAVTVCAVDDQRRPLPETATRIPCDTLILSVGLIPENELSRMAGVQLDSQTGGPVVDQFLQTTVPGIFAAGNVLHVHDVADDVSAEAEFLAEQVRRYLAGPLPPCPIAVTGRGCGHVVPQRLCRGEAAVLSFRPAAPRRHLAVEAVQDGQTLCRRTIPYATPAQMVHLPIPDLADGSPVEVCCYDDENPAV